MKLGTALLCSDTLLHRSECSYPLRTALQCREDALNGLPGQIKYPAWAPIHIAFMRELFKYFELQYIFGGRT